MSEQQLAISFDPAVQHTRPVESTPDIAMVGRFHKGGTDTEIAAAERIAPVSGKQRQAVFAAFEKAGSAGLTDYEAHALARCSYPHVAATRRSELMRLGFPIVDSNQRRQTPSGRLAVVWVLQTGEDEKSESIL